VGVVWIEDALLIPSGRRAAFPRHGGPYGIPDLLGNLIRAAEAFRCLDMEFLRPRLIWPASCSHF
jgi:hypothetical protein